MKTIAAIGTLAVIYSGLAAMPAAAAPIYYGGTDINLAGGALANTPNADAASASFQAALAGVGTETFDELPAFQAFPLTLDFPGTASNITASLTGSGFIGAGLSGTDQYGLGLSHFLSLGTGQFTVAFDRAVSAIGFYAIDIESAASVDFTYADGSNGQHSLADLASSATKSGSVFFFGMIDTAHPITGFSITNTTSSDIFAFDNFTIGDAPQVITPPAVPEPASWAMMLAGFGLAGSMMRRSRASVGRAAALRG